MCGADRVERPGEQQQLAEPLGECDRACAGGDRARHVAREHAQDGERRVRLGERPARGERLSEGDRGLGGFVHVRVVAVVPQVVRAAAEERRFALAVALGSPELDRLRGRDDGLAHAVHAIARRAVAFEQLGTITDRQMIGVSQCARIVVGGLPVCADRRRPLARRRRVNEHGRHVVGLLRVIGEPGLIGATGREIGERAAVQREPPSGQDAVLDRAARQLMPEADVRAVAHQHAGSHAGVDVFGRRLDHRQQRVPRKHRDRAERVTFVRCERGRAGQHGVADRARHPPIRIGEHLGHEERIAAGAGMELGGVDAARAGERVDGLAGQRREVDAKHSGAGRERTEHRE